MSSCEGCRYYKRLGSSGGKTIKACHYCYDTGRVRGCAPERCDKREAEDDRRQKQA